MAILYTTDGRSRAVAPKIVGNALLCKRSEVQ
jgi:hypothetical protein